MEPTERKRKRQAGDKRPFIWRAIQDALGFYTQNVTMSRFYGTSMGMHAGPTQDLESVKELLIDGSYATGVGSTNNEELAYAEFHRQDINVAGSRKPGPQCSHDAPLDTNDGTMCIALPLRPGPIGTTPKLAEHNQRGDHDAIFSQALQIAPAALYRETGYVFNSGISQGFVLCLIQTLKTLISNNGGIAAHFSTKDILLSLDLDILTDCITGNLGDVNSLVQLGISTSAPRTADHNRETEAAADALASAVGVLARLILQGIVAYLLRASSNRAAIATEPSVQISTSNIASNPALALLADHLRSSKLGDGFATWVEKNLEDLLAHPRLRLGSMHRSGGVDHVVSERRTRTPSPSRQEPPPDPPTFSDINFSAQAATLIAAAARGAPFCPV